MAKRFHEYKKFIEAGDTVLVYMNRDSIVPIVIDPEQCLKNKFGEFPHSKMIGVEYGSQMESNRANGYIYLLHPTPELWTSAVPHRTQILYPPDISLISLKLNLKPGSVVIESGTGSGAFSHAIIRSIANTGHLYTFEYHEQRVAKVREEFKHHNLTDLVTVSHRDVCKDGFDLENIADAVFLDLPAPWEAIPAAAKALKKSITGKICTFSPCIEQVQRTADALNENSFFGIETFECLVRDYNTINLSMPDIQSAIDGEKVKFKFVKGKKRMFASEPKLETEPENRNNSSAQKITFDDTNKAEENIKYSAAESATNTEPTFILASKPETTPKGHTSYLTFASYFGTNGS